ncbi:potential E3 ubiquitin-protein ligase ariadne-2-like [Trachinotus anak]|uniref:potential E3 ubiquitin-protein ligase ariadne-2-like n=1 Tax=Trachinotus anak TaxID=443729 RepID=UPI0039F17091
MLFRCLLYINGGENISIALNRIIHVTCSFKVKVTHDHPQMAQSRRQDGFAGRLRQWVEMGLDVAAFHTVQPRVHPVQPRVHPVQPRVQPEQLQGEKCYDPGDPTLRFVDTEDELDFLCEGFTSRRALMSCGHAVTPTSLTNWCRRLLDQGKSRFTCGQSGCTVEWPYTEVRKMALLTPGEREYFEKTLASNARKFILDTKFCPGCRSSLQRKKASNLRVRCSVCTATNGRSYEFCWQCLREWKGPYPRADRCENDGCCNESLKTLKNCPDIVFETVMGVTGCPSIRACPTCGSLVEHSRRKCKSIVCPRCRIKFCFVCLKLTKKCLETSDYFIHCSSGVAPRQTSIPVWGRK